VLFEAWLKHGQPPKNGAQAELKDGPILRKLLEKPNLMFIKKWQQDSLL
jgi:hypothetical protein